MPFKFLGFTMLNYRPDPQLRQEKRPGFTLVELLVVIAIILILSGIVFGLTGGINDKQARTKAETELNAMGMALESYKLKYKDYPWLGAATGEALFKHLTGEHKMKPGEPKNPTTDATGDGKPFIDASKLTMNTAKTAFVDPWGNEYEYYYKSPGASSDNWEYAGFILLSKGSDGSINASSLSTGKIDADHFKEEENVDNLVFGFQY